MKEYIEREVAIEAILGLTIVDSTVAAYANAVYSILHNLPAADVAPVRHGRWLKRLNDTPYCSVCGANERDTYDAVVQECKYCYSCGALMDKEEDNHETS